MDLTEATNAAFRRVLGANSELLDDSPDPDLYDRLLRLQSLHRGMAMFHRECLAQPLALWPKVLRERARQKMRLHADAAKCIRRRIERLMKRGIL